MKNIILFIILCCAFSLNAQEAYSIAAGGKTIEFDNIGELTIVGTSESKMSISRSGNDRHVDERAKGLRKISASGRQDNTGFGVAVNESGGVIRVEQVGSKNDRITVKVPNSAIVKIESVGHQGGKVEIKDFSGELDASIQYHRITLTNVTGPIAVNTIYGGITAIFNKQPTNPVQLLSAYDDIDLSLPAATKADIQLSTSYGSMYTDFDLQVKSNTSQSDSHDDHDHCGSGLIGKINGGGVAISLTSNYNDLYLRKL